MIRHASNSPCLLAVACLWCVAPAADGHAAAPLVPNHVIGYTEFRTDLPDGRHTNVRTMRAVAVSLDTGKRRVFADGLLRDADTWTSFAGWSPDGRTAIVGLGWQSQENAKWEEQNRTFRHVKDGRLLDVLLIDVATGKATNVTAVERVSVHNFGLFYWPRDPTKFGFTALIGNNGHPFKMDRDGRNKVDLTKGSRQFSYGFNPSPDGKRIAYNKDYRVYLADADGSNPVAVNTGTSFEFQPYWSPDGKRVLFVAGDHYNCHPHVVGADGKGLKKLADRGGYRGVVEFLDVHDFHGGSSDLPVWAFDGRSVFYTAQVGKAVELFCVTLDGKSERLTKSEAGTLHYHPQASPDGKWLLYGSKRGGVRQLYVMRLADRAEKRITDLKAGHGAMWAHWRPGR